MKTEVLSVRQKVVRDKRPSLWHDIKRNKWLYALCFPSIVFFLIFAYIPIGGLYIAFVDYKASMGIYGSRFVGLENFRFFFETDAWKLITKNTLWLNFLFIVTGTASSVAIAIMLSEISKKLVKKVTQSVIILPHFMSWTIVAMFSVALISSNGFINQIIVWITGNPDATINFYNDAKVWPTLLVCFRIWQGAGFSSIVYLATITGIDQEIYEAAAIDGANRWRCIMNITLPMLKNTVIILTLMSVGKIFNGDFGMIYPLVGNNTLLHPTTDVIDTYLVRALMNSDNMGMTAAVGLVQSILGFTFVIGCNAVANKFSKEAALF